MLVSLSPFLNILDHQVASQYVSSQNSYCSFQLFGGSQYNLYITMISSLKLTFLKQLPATTERERESCFSLKNMFVVESLQQVLLRLYHQPQPLPQCPLHLYNDDIILMESMVIHYTHFPAKTRLIAHYQPSPLVYTVMVVMYYLNFLLFW